MTAFGKYIYEFGNFESKFGCLMNDDSGPIYDSVDYEPLGISFAPEDETTATITLYNSKL